MVRQMISREQKLSQSQQGSSSSSQEALSASQQSQEMSAEDQDRAQNPKAQAGWFLRQMEETFNKAGDFNINTTAQRKSFVFSKLSPDFGPSETPVSPTLESADPSLPLSAPFQSADSNLPDTLYLSPQSNCRCLKLS